MANKKTKSGFSVPAIGTAYPVGTMFKKNKDGTVTPIYPKKVQKTKKR